MEAANGRPRERQCADGAQTTAQQSLSSAALWSDLDGSLPNGNIRPISVAGC
jgi:hypothetical protein